MNNQLVIFLKTVTLWIVILCCKTITVGQPIDANVDVLSIKDGVDKLEVDNFFIGKDDRIWLSTKGCLNICNPKRVENIYFGNGENQIHSPNTIVAIKENEEHVDIFYKGVYQFYDRYDVTSRTFSKIMIDTVVTVSNQEYVTTIEFNKDIYIVTKTNEGLMFCAISTKKNHNVELGSGFNVKDVLLYPNGFYFLTVEDKVYNYSEGNGVKRIGIKTPTMYETYKVVGKEIRQNKQIFHLDNKGRLWFSLLKYPGVFMKDNAALSLSLYKKIPQEKLFTWISEDDTGKLLFATTNRYRFTKGFYLLNKNDEILKWEYLSTHFTLPRKIISKDFYDEMFISTYRNLMILNFKSHDFLNTYFVNEAVRNQQGAYGNIVWGMSMINKDSMFVSSEYPHIGYFNIKTKEYSRINTSREKLLFQHQYSSKEDVIWMKVFDKEVKTQYQLYQFNLSENNFEIFPIDSALLSITIGNMDVLYCAILDKKGKYYLKKHLPHHQDLISLVELPFKSHYMKYDSSSNSIWGIDLSKGIYQIDMRNSDYNISQLPIEPIDGINYYGINHGSHNKLYISTSMGLFIWDKQEQKIIKQLTVKDGLSANSVCAVVEDIKGNLWISTFSGLDYYIVDIDVMKQYAAIDGIADEEFNTRTWCKDDQNNIYFGSSNGLVRIDINEFYSRKFKIEVQDVLVVDNNQAMKYQEIPDKIKIHKDSKTRLSLEICSNEWMNKEKVKYITNLKPYDKFWKENNGNSINLTQLPKGSYTLSVMAINAEGTISNKITIPFEVYKKWYEKNWFRLLTGFLLISSIIFGIWYYFDREKRKKEITKIQFEKRVSELELGILQAQMNPHFVFNSISAIQSNIDNEEKELVSKYLNDFASLMRLFLESSRTKHITLEREIRLLKLYISLEKLRFGDRIRFNISVDDKLNIFYIKIPTMILQPFVENAINHGLFHKMGKGKLEIEFKAVNGHVHISIKDDGIGRKKAQEIRDRSLKNYKSAALKIIAERLDILKNTDNYIIDIQIKDLYDHDKNPCGTEVIVIIPSDE